MPKKKVFAQQPRLEPLLPMGTVKPCPIITDPQGCYTGKPIEKYEMPIQDADDL